ncbi:MAG: flavodoxin family protein [Ilumatobacteraceae bacterium]
MKALVVYESMYGNTRHIAEAIAEGLQVSIEARAIPVGDVRTIDVDNAQLVVVGAPTHAWGLSRRRTREVAASDMAKHSEQRVSQGALATGVREWMRGLKLQRSCRSAAFDTRLDRPRLFTGSAVRAIGRGLVAAGFSVFGEPHTFRVSGTTGPLAFGEIERAREWGEAMGRTMVQLDGVGSAKKATSR